MQAVFARQTFQPESRLGANFLLASWANWWGAPAVLHQSPLSSALQGTGVS